MSRDELKVGVGIKKFVIFITTKFTKICYRSIRNHPFVAGILLFLLFLYRSSPFLFSLLVSVSPVLVCTAVLLGTLLSFGDPSIVSSHEEDDKVSGRVGLKTGRVEDNLVVEEDEYLTRSVSKFTELRNEIVKKIDEEPLLDIIDKNNSEKEESDVQFSSVHDNYVSREIRFEKEWIDELKSELENKESENTEIEEIVDLSDQSIRARVEVGLSDGEALQNRVLEVEKVQAEQSEDYKSADGSIDAQMSELLGSLESWKRLDEVVTDNLSSSRNVHSENFEDYKSAEGSVDAQVMDQIEPSLASWKQLDEIDDGLSRSRDVEDERFEDYRLGEESSEARIRARLESSLRSWEQFGSDRDDDDDDDDEFDSGSDGAESSSPDASMADIIPMLDELDPLLEDQIPLVSDLSRQNSVAKSHGSSIHSVDESDQKEDGDGGKSECDDDNEGGEENEGGKEDHEKSAIMWTADDQKNLMDLGTSELERNQRLESLIARRRARKMAVERNMMDLEGMDLTFPVAPILTRKLNPFDFPHDSYDDLGLPPIPGSAPSVMLNRRNPFDLPYDSSEEKPDLTGDSFQQEFMELNQRETTNNHREAMFRRNETFNVGSSAFDFGRPSRFRPYFIPERTDSDVMSSYSSLNRQFSELSESKASSIGETDATSVGPEQEEKKLLEHDSSQEVEPSSEIDHVSLLVERGSESDSDLDSLSGDDKLERENLWSVREVELGGKSSQFEDIHNDIQLTTPLIEVKHNISSSILSVPKELHKVEDISTNLVSEEKSQVNEELSIEIPVNHSPETSISEMTTDRLLDNTHPNVVDNDNRKEPIFDLSPLKKDLSLSSSSSDLQRETSGIDIYHLSRDLFVVEETYVHNKHAEIITRQPEQDGEPVLTEVESQLNIDNSEREVEEKLSDNEKSPCKIDHDFITRDGSQIYRENSEDDESSSSDDSISSGGLEFLEESVLIHEKEGNVLEENALFGNSELSRENMGVEMEVNQQSIVSSLESHEVDTTEKLDFCLDENHFLAQDSTIDESSGGPQGQEQLVVNRKLEEIDQTNKVEPVNVFEVQEHELHNPSDSLQTTVSSSQPDESVTKPTVDFAIEDHTQEISDDLKGSIPDDLVVNEKESDVKELDETLVSELDAAGDFSFSNNASNSMTIDNLSGVLDECIGADVLETKESSLNLSVDSQVFEAQSVEDIDGTFTRGNEESRNSVVSESSHVEFSGKEEVSVLERESMEERDASEEIEPEKVQPDLDLIEAQNLDPDRIKIDFGIPVRDADIVEQSGEDVEKVAENFDIVEAGIDSVEFTPIINREKTEMDESQLEVEPRDETESLGSIKFDSSQIDRDIEGVEESVLRDANNPLALESDESEKTLKMPVHEANIENEARFENESGKNTSQSLPLEEENDEIQESAFTSEDHQREVSEQRELDISTPSILSALEFEKEREVVQYLESESLKLDEESGKIQDSSLLETSIVCSMDFKQDEQVVESRESDPMLMHGENERIQDLNALQENIPPHLESEEKNLVTVGSLKSEPSILDEEREVIDVSPLVTASIASPLEFEEEKEVVESLESEPSLLDEEREVIDVSPLVTANIASPLVFDEEKEVFESLESEPSILDEEREMTYVSHLVTASIASPLEFEEEKEVVESLESEPLQKDEVVEQLREWHVVEESSSLAVKSEDQIERTNPTESHSLKEDASDSKETEKVTINKEIGKLPEFSDVCEKSTPVIESEGQLERFYSVGFEFSQMVGDFKEIEESSNQRTFFDSIVEVKDEMEFDSQVEDHQLVSHEQPEIDVPNVGNEIHTDSSAVVIQSSNNEVDQDNNISSEIEEKSHESHLVFSSSSSSSSSSDSDEN